MAGNAVIGPPLLRLFLFVVLFQSAIAQQQTEEREKQVLLRLKSHWNDPASLSSWIGTSPSSTAHCSWNGITCNNSTTGPVTAISLPQQGIEGDIPPFLCGSDGLANLTALDLFNNSISGAFPSSALSLCTSLRSLNLSQNLLVGPLPSDLDRVLPRQLEYLVLNGNNLSGEVPAAVGGFPALRQLCLDNNLFNGTIPKEIGNLASLEYLTLAVNDFTPGPIPDEFANLTKLTYIFMAEANLIGEIPAWVGAKLTELETLDLSINGLNGTFPASIWGLKNLKFLYLYKNKLSGNITIPAAASAVKFAALGLEEIDISRNQLTGVIPQDFAKLQNLKYLILYDNMFSGQIPTGIGLLPSLYDVRLFNNRLTGPLPPELGTKSSLWSLEAWNNALTGDIPTGLCAGGRLVSIQLFDNSFTGKVPDSLANCSSLLDVKMYNNQLSGEFPPGFWDINDMHTLMIHNNRELFGELPARLTWNFTRLDISNNSFSGKIPSTAISLVDFRASNNNISGELPEDLPRSLPRLESLILDGNFLSGAVPPSIGGMMRLAVLDLGNNKLTGSIPDTIGNMSVINYLDLSHNRLSGRIPAKLGGLRLSFLNLSSNLLVGEVPLPLQNDAFQRSFLSNSGLCSSDGRLPGVLPPCDGTKSGNRSSGHLSKGLLVLVVALAILLATGAGVLGFFAVRERQRRRKGGGSASSTGDWKLTSFGQQAAGFCITESGIIRGLTSDNLIGCGGSGQVYRIRLGDHETVAVKKIWSSVKKQESRLEKEFWAEVQILGSIRHRNIVKLLCCMEEGGWRNPVDNRHNSHNKSSSSTKLLVYEYMVNGSLHQWLHGRGVRRGQQQQLGPNMNRNILDWPTRLIIAIGSARGLCYLHHDCGGSAIVHRDVKSSNILLDADFNPKVADFGLARILNSAGGGGVSTVAAGSLGYMAPECAFSDKVDEKVDVYSFGVVLLELVTGRQAHEGSDDGSGGLADWVWRHILEGGKAIELVDEDIRGEVKVEEVETLVKLGVLCTGSLPSTRPNMKDVLYLLLRGLGARSDMMRFYELSSDYGSSVSGCSDDGSVDEGGPLRKKWGSRKGVGSRRKQAAGVGDDDDAGLICKV